MTRSIQSGTTDASRVADVRLSGEGQQFAAPPPFRSVAQPVKFLDVKSTTPNNTSLTGSGTGFHVPGLRCNLMTYGDRQEPVGQAMNDAHKSLSTYWKALPTGQSMSHEQMMNVVVASYQRENGSPILTDTQHTALQVIFNANVSEDGSSFTVDRPDNYLVTDPPRYSLSDAAFQPPPPIRDPLNQNCNGTRFSIDQMSRVTSSDLLKTSSGYAMACKIAEINQPLGNADSRLPLIEKEGRIDQMISFCSNYAVQSNDKGSDYVATPRDTPIPNLSVPMWRALEQKFDITFTDFNGRTAIDNKTGRTLNLMGVNDRVVLPPEVLKEANIKPTATTPAPTAAAPAPTTSSSSSSGAGIVDHYDKVYKDPVNKKDLLKDGDFDAKGNLINGREYVYDESGLLDHIDEYENGVVIGRGVIGKQ